jgi:hypothetical protein
MQAVLGKPSESSERGDLFFNLHPSNHVLLDTGNPATDNKNEIAWNDYSSDIRHTRP